MRLITSEVKNSKKEKKLSDSFSLNEQGKKENDKVRKDLPGIFEEGTISEEEFN